MAIKMKWMGRCVISGLSSIELLSLFAVMDIQFLLIYRVEATLEVSSICLRKVDTAPNAERHFREISPKASATSAGSLLA